jgi:hypothetical protein
LHGGLKQVENPRRPEDGTCDYTLSAGLSEKTDHDVAGPDQMASNSGRADQSAKVATLADEFLDRCRAGERPSVESYCTQHPEIASEIREVFDACCWSKI